MKKEARPSRGASMSRDLGRIAERMVQRFEARAWPAYQWASDPVGFMRTFLAFDPWDRQCEIAELVRDNARVAIASGHRIGKTDLLGALAIWFYCCFRDARAILVGPTSDQINRAAYRSVKKLLGYSGRCVECTKSDPDGPKPCPHSALITGDIGASSDHGVRSINDQREIRGVNVRSPEAAQGIAGENIIILADEASGDYFDKILGAMAGNRAGGAKMVLFGNPIRSVGEFADAFEKKSEFYVTRKISSEETPNVKLGKMVIPGLATRDWVEEQAAEWGGRDSPFFKMRVAGQFVSVAEGQIFQPGLLEEATKRWKDLRDPETGQHYAPPSGQLVVAVDPAGESGDRDDSVFLARRGNDVLELYTRRGLSPDAHVAEVLGLIDRYRHGTEIVPVMHDAAGDIGAKVRGAFITHVQSHPNSPNIFWVRHVQSGQRAQRDPERYQMVRDEMCAACADWLQRGGAIPDDAKLKLELSRFAWLRHVTDRAKATSKDGPGGLREQLGWSPGRADVLMLSTWVRADGSPDPAKAPTAPTTPSQALDQLQRGAPGRPAGGPWNPYDALKDFYKGR